MTDDIASPCIGICKLDVQSVCTGCGRSIAEIAESLQIGSRTGVLITGVLQNGPASEGGMLPGDVVISVGDNRVLNTAQLLNAVAALKPQAATSISVQRGNQLLSLKITAAQRPKNLASAARGR